MYEKYLMNRFCAKFHENACYHVYNRGNNKENIFFKPGNYQYFLKKYQDYLFKYLDTFCYSLLPNHFHLFVRVRKKTVNSKDIHDDMDRLISEQFRCFFIAYSQAINKQESRSGSLFQKPFKRIRVESDRHSTALLSYIHINPRKHRLMDDFARYPYSSYSSLIDKRKTFLCREEVLSWFGSKDEFVRFHKDMQLAHLDDKLIIEK